MRKKLEDLSREEMLALLTAILAELRSPYSQGDPSAFCMWLEGVFSRRVPSADWEVELP